MSTAPTVFVCGATGTQGGAVARQLRDLNWTVRTTTRNPSSPAAQALTALGVTCLPGDWNDESSLAPAIAGCTHLFLNLLPDFTNPTAETTAAQTILRVAKAAGVEQVVYSGALIRDAPTQSLMSLITAVKVGIEEQVRAAGFEHWTFLRPGYFMVNLLSPKAEMLYPGATETGVFRFAFRPDTKLPMIDPEDIGGFAVAAFRDPERFHGKTIDLVGENCKVEDAIEAIRGVTGKDIKAVYLSDEEIREAAAGNPVLGVQVLMRDMDAVENVDAIRNWGVDVGGFERFVKREAKAFQETYALKN